MKESNSTAVNTDYPDKWKEELDTISNILSKTTLKKVIKWGSNVYTHNGKNVVSYGGFKNYFAIWFYKGVFLKDKHKLLINAQEGVTKSLRQWRLTSKQEIDEKILLEYIAEAIEIEEKGLNIAPAKPSLPAIPEMFQKELNKNASLRKAFEKLTIGRRKEYILYIEEAKQESTKQKRLEKISPMILSGHGLNDKYK